MNALHIVASLLAASLSMLACGSRAVSSSAEKEEWSREINGLQARLTMIEKGRLYGTRWLVPYLELRNVRNLLDQTEVNCDGHHLKVELVDAGGKSVRDGQSLPRSGPTFELNTVILRGIVPSASA